MKFFEKPIVQIGLIILIAGLVGAGIFASRNFRPSKEPVVESANKDFGKTEPEREEVTFGGAESKVVKGVKVEALPIARPKPPPPPVKIASTESKEKSKNQEVKAQLPTLVLSESNVGPPPERNIAAPQVFGPRGLLIKAVLVLTVDSSSLETPVLALVTEDVFWGGKLLVPAGTQVFAKASNGKIRDRIEITGEFTFVWADGREYKIHGIALNREVETETSFSITDGSAGIKGEIMDSAEKRAELKLLLAEMVAGFAEQAQSRIQTVFGEQSEQSPSNGALGGTSGAGQRYAELLLGKIEEDLTFVRVPAGSEFYIFTEDVFEPQLASIAGLRQGNEALSGVALQQRSYEEKQRDYEQSLQRAAAVANREQASVEQAKESERAEYLDRVNALISAGRTEEE